MAKPIKPTVFEEETGRYQYNNQLEANVPAMTLWKDPHRGLATARQSIRYTVDVQIPPHIEANAPSLFATLELFYTFKLPHHTTSSSYNNEAYSRYSCLSSGCGNISGRRVLQQLCVYPAV